MSNYWFNIRLGNYHWVLGPNNKYYLKVKFNRTHALWRKSRANWKWFRVYTAFGRSTTDLNL